MSYVKGTIVNFSEISENYFDGGIYEWRVNGVKVEDNYKLDEDTTFQVIRTINGKYSFAGTCSGEEVTATFDIIDGEVQNVVSSNKYGFSDLFFYVTIINGDFDYRIKVEFYLRTDPVMSPVSFGCILFDYSQGQFTLYQTSGGDVSGTVTRIK